MSTLVLGAGGFVGKYLVPALAKNPRFGEIFAVSRHAAAYPQAQNVSCELTDATAVNRLVEQTKPDYVFHLAGSSRVSEATPFPEYHANNFVTTECLCEALVKARRPTSVFFASSIHVYGNQSKAADESCPPEPVTAYGFTKYLAEQRLQKATVECPDLKVTVGRLYSCTGPGQAEGYVVTDLARKILKAKHGQADHIAVGSLSGKRRFLDIRDVVPIIIGLTERRDAARFSVFNIAPDTSYQIQEVLQLLLKHAQVSPRIESSAQYANPLRDLEIDNAKLKEALPALQLRPLTQTLADLFDSLQP